MKKYLSIVILLFAVFLISCLEDEGNYDYIDLGDFYVDTTSVRQNFTTKQFSTFSLDPRLVYNGDKSALEYKWELYKSELTWIGSSSYGTGYSHNYTRDDYPDYSISDSEHLSTVISAPPGEYYLVFTATDKKTGLKATADYRLTVEGVIGSGLAVLYKNSSGIDVDIVATPLFNGSLTEESYIRHAYSTANPSRPFAGEPRQLVSAIYPAYSHYYIYLTSTEDAVRLSSIDMSVVHEFNDLFAGKVPAVKDLNGIVIRNYNHFFINDGVAYKCSGNAGVEMTPMGMANEDYYAVAVNWVFAINSLFYDASKRRFIFSQMWSAEISPVINSAQHFDFGHVNKDLIHWSAGYYQGMTYTNYCFFKNPTDDGKRYMYVFLADERSPSSFTSKCAMDISTCTDIASAQYFATGERGPVVFYATDSKVYRLNYNVDESTSDAKDVWSVPENETITHIELFKHKGLNVANRTDDKYLLIATYHSPSGKGKIYVIESDISSGVLAKDPVATWEFEGRIADFDFIAQ